GGNGAERFDSTLCHSGIDGIAAAAANAKNADSVCVHIRERHQIIDHSSKIFNGLNRILDKAWFTAACALKTTVESDNDKANFCQSLTINVSRGLFLAATDGMGTYNCGIRLGFVEFGWKMDIRRNFPVHIGVAKSDCLHFSVSGFRSQQLA